MHAQRRRSVDLRARPLHECCVVVAQSPGDDGDDEELAAVRWPARDNVECADEESGVEVNKHTRGGPLMNAGGVIVCAMYL